MPTMMSIKFSRLRGCSCSLRKVILICNITYDVIVLDGANHLLTGFQAFSARYVDLRRGLVLTQTCVDGCWFLSKCVSFVD